MDPAACRSRDAVASRTSSWTIGQARGHLTPEERCELAQQGSWRLMDADQQRAIRGCCTAAAAGTLLPAVFFGKATTEHLHLAHRLLVALALGGTGTVQPRGQRFVEALRGDERLAQHLPRRRVRRIELDRPPQVNDRRGGVATLQVLAAEPEAKQRA